VSGSLGVALPYWLDRPDEEAVEIAQAAERAGIERLWIGEMASFDAFALASAIGLRAPRLRLTIGPLAIAVRSPVAIALGLSSVATLTGCAVDLALGASSPAIVSGWHGRAWAAPAARMGETVPALRALLAGERASGFKLRRPVAGASITVAAFGPAMTRVASGQADEVVLNLVTAEHVERVRTTIDAEARAAGRAAPRLAVWLPVALDPRDAALAQMSGQLAVYLAPPGYGEMFGQLGFGSLVQRARSGVARAELAAAIPVDLLGAVCAIGSAEHLCARIAEYHAAGADHVAVVPATAEDNAGVSTLAAVTAQLGSLR
jgi:probable F420-dependent oxidoreductase